MFIDCASFTTRLLEDAVEDLTFDKATKRLDKLDGLQNKEDDFMQLQAEKSQWPNGESPAEMLVTASSWMSFLKDASLFLESYHAKEDQG